MTPTNTMDLRGRPGLAETSPRRATLRVWQCEHAQSRGPHTLLCGHRDAEHHDRLVVAASFRNTRDGGVRKQRREPTLEASSTAGSMSFACIRQPRLSTGVSPVSSGAQRERPIERSKQRSGSTGSCATIVTDEDVPDFVPQVRSCGDEPALKRGRGGFGACSPVWCRSSDTDLNPHERHEAAGQDGGAAVGVQLAVSCSEDEGCGLAASERLLAREATGGRSRWRSLRRVLAILTCVGWRTTTPVDACVCRMPDAGGIRSRRIGDASRSPRAARMASLVVASVRAA